MKKAKRISCAAALAVLLVFLVYILMNLGFALFKV